MVDLDIRQLEYFVSAASTGSYSQAARQLFVTPQAISRSIQLLEARIGTQLFRRTPSGIALTDAGTACLQPAQEALSSLQRLQDLAASYRQDESIAVILGAHSLCFRENGGSIDRTELIAFQKQHSTLALSFIEMAGNAVIDALRSDAIDIGVTVPPHALAKSNDLERRSLKSFPIAAVVSQDFARDFAQGRDIISIDELANGELILFSDETEYNNCLIERASLAGIELPLSVLRISPHGNMGFIAGSQLYIVRPVQHARRTIHDERLRILPIQDAEGRGISMDLELLTKRGKRLSAGENSLVAFIQACYR